MWPTKRLFPEFGTVHVDRVKYRSVRDYIGGEIVSLRTPFLLKFKCHTMWWLAHAFHNIEKAFGKETSDFMFHHLKGDECLREHIERMDNPELAKYIRYSCSGIADVLLRQISEIFHNYDDIDILVRFRRAISTALQLTPSDLAGYIVTARSHMFLDAQPRCLRHEYHALMALFLLENHWSFFLFTPADVSAREISESLKEDFAEKGIKLYDLMPIFIKNHETPRHQAPLTRAEYLKSPYTICDHCNKPGHIRPNCRALRKRSSRGKSNLKRKRPRFNPA